LSSILIICLLFTEECRFESCKIGLGCLKTFYIPLGAFYERVARGMIRQSEKFKDEKLKGKSYS
jgi:hypothetical protein